MNFFLRCLLNSLLAVAAVSSAAVYSEPIEFVYRPSWKVENYLTFLLSKIPLDQYKAGAGETIHLSGPIVITFKNLPESIKASVTLEVSRAFKGERSVSGAILETSAAQLIFGGDALPYVEPEFQPTPIEDSRFTYTAPDEEAIRREVEERLRWEELQTGGSLGCSPMLLGHIEK